MKIITSLLKKATIILSFLSILSCTVESLDINQFTDSQNPSQSNLTCLDAQPEARFVNNGTTDFTFVVFSPSLGLITEVVDVAPGVTTNWIAFPEGEIILGLDSSVSSISDFKTQVTMQACDTYELVMQPNNTVLPGGPIGN
ncbi:hypothetical protein [Lacinutrix chionoecetis]